MLQLQSRTNTQQVNLRSGVTIAEDSAIVQAAAKARPAVVSVVTQQLPTLSRGSGYLATTDGYIVTNIDVIAGAGTMTVLVPGDPAAHDARLVDYDCQTGVAVIKIDKVSGLPTLAFADPTALVQGQLIVAVGGPFEGGAVTPGYVSAMHQVVSIANPSTAPRSLELSDTILTSSVISAGTAGGPMLNVGGQVIGIAMQSQPSTQTNGFGLNVADVQDDVQQILQTGQGDVITQLDDVKLDAAHPLRLLLRSRFHPNQKVTVTYSRGGASSQAQVTLTGQHPTCS